MASRSREIIIPVGAFLVSPHLELQFCVPPWGGQSGPKGNGEQAEVSKEGGRGDGGGCREEQANENLSLLKLGSFP